MYSTGEKEEEEELQGGEVWSKEEECWQAGRNQQFFGRKMTSGQINNIGPMKTHEQEDEDYVESEERINRIFLYSSVHTLTLTLTQYP